MKLKLLLSALLLLAIAFVNAQPRTPDTPALEKSEMRCGWFSNPTPANASLYDRDGEWIIGVQGGYQADGDWPAFSAKEWIKQTSITATVARVFAYKWIAPRRK